MIIDVSYVSNVILTKSFCFEQSNNNIPAIDEEDEDVSRSLLDLGHQDFDRASSYGFSCMEHLPGDHQCRAEGCERVVINVSGLKFETQLRTMNRLPNTLLGNPNKRKKFWDASRNEFFFDRHRPTFQAVLYYYQSGGRLKKPLEVPLDIFLNELHFFELGPNVISNFKQKEGCLADEKVQPMPEKKWKRKIWEAVEYPESSVVAKVFAAFSVLFILISVVIFCIETLPEFADSGCEDVNVTDSYNVTTTVSAVKWDDPIFIIESFCIAFFVFELVTRFLTCPAKTVFLKDTINWIDVLAISPYFVFLGKSVFYYYFSN